MVHAFEAEEKARQLCQGLAAPNRLQSRGQRILGTFRLPVSGPPMHDASLNQRPQVEIYRYRYYVDLFPEWIRQHVRIKAFSGRTGTAAKIQIRIALTVYMLAALVRKRLGERQPIPGTIR
jgi:hypothetical protein